MVFVRMGEHQSVELLDALNDVAGVGHDHVHTRHGVAAEGDTAVHHEPSAAIAEQVQVHADLARSAERQEQQLTVLGFARLGALRRSHQRLFRW